MTMLLSRSVHGSHFPIGMMVIVLFFVSRLRRRLRKDTAKSIVSSSKNRQQQNPYLRHKTNGCCWTVESRKHLLHERVFAMSQQRCTTSRVLYASPDKRWARDLNNSTTSHRCGMAGKMAISLWWSYFVMWNPANANRSIRPTHFKETIGHYRRRFKGYDQQDAQELLQHLLSCVHEDLQSNCDETCFGTKR